MNFYIDESGHTGPNLFDSAQPRLYYGVLRSETDLDTKAQSDVENLRVKLEVDRLHASELGIGRLTKILPELLTIQKKFDLCFDIYRVQKVDHAAICFFDQVFDAGLNPAVPWTGYWTPLRYLLLLKVHFLFDLETLKDAWSARIDPNPSSANTKFLSVCNTILQRVTLLPDARSREIISDTLNWAIKHPDKIYYNCSSKKQILEITPNMIGFQFVLAGIAKHLESPSQIGRIVVDQQSQFNKSQQRLSDVYSNMRNAQTFLGPGLPRFDLTNLPNIPLQFSAGSESVGLELVDIYLWVFKRFLDGNDLPCDFAPLINSQSNRGEFDEVSIAGITNRWLSFFEQLPELSPEQLEKSMQLVKEQEARRKKAMASDN